MATVRPGILRVAIREVVWIAHDRVALLLVVGIPLLAFTLLAATFSNAVIRNLRVDVVDQDRSQTSMIFVQAINAAPTVDVTSRSSDLTGAMRAIRSGEAIAAVYIPQDFERDILAGRRPQIVIFHNKQYYTPGNIASGGLQAAIAAAVATLPKGGNGSGTFTPGPLVVEQYVLTNPALNYVQFLLRAVLPTVLHVITAIAGGYAVGSEFRLRNLREWIDAAGGSPLTALVGKLAPYFGIFIVMMAVELGIIHGLFQIPFRGDPILVGAAACLLIVAYLALGSLLQLLVRNLALGLALTGIICSPAFGFAGVGFPILGMGTFGRAWGALLPLRWYIQILFDQAARGVPPRDTVEPFMVLCTLVVIYFGVAWLRLRTVARAPIPNAPDKVVREAPDQAGVVGAFSTEYGRVLRDPGVFGLMVLAPIIYGLLYPQPYLGQLLRKVPIAVVDNDTSDLSRLLIQMLDADEAIRVAVRADTLADAQAALGRREVFGIVGIPAGAEREVFKGNSARLPAYVDSAYFLLYNRAVQGISEATGAVSSDLIARGARSDGSLYRAALVKSAPVEVLNQPLFNPTSGYGSYIVPAAFILILQQTLLMGAATLGGVAFEQGGLGARRRRGMAAAVLGQGLAHLLLALPGFALYVIVLPRAYGFTAVGRVPEVLALGIPFILAVSFMGQFVGAWFRRRETAVLLLIAISLPLFFLVGVSWPLEAIPNSLRIASRAFPSTSGIDGLVRLNQMGATLADVSSDWSRLWILATLYAVLAILTSWLVSMRGGPMFPGSRLPLKLALVAAVALGSLESLAAHAQGSKPSATNPGLVRKTEIHVAPEINGRLVSIAVRPGQHVHKGDVLAGIDNPEVAASVEEAKAAAAAAKAERDHVYAGVRAEEVAIAAEAIRTAEANLLLAQQESARATTLSLRGYSTGQQLDESRATLAKAQADLDLKRAQFAAANAGPTAEERSLADARVALALATVDDLQAKLDKTTLRSPVDAMVRVLVAEPGEILSPGKPIMTIEADGPPWFTFTLREDTLGDLTIGGRVSLQTSLGHPIEAQVTELRPLGEFATWRAARAVGDHDLNSFLVRLEPSTGGEDLEPGMTIWLSQ